MTSKKLSLESDMKKTETAGKGIGLSGLIGENLRRNIWLLLLGMVVMLFAYPVNMGMQMSYYSGRIAQSSLVGNSERVISYTKEMAESANRVLTGEYSFLFIIVFVAAVLCALGLFGWVFNKNKVDFYNSQPITRKKRFLSLYLTGLIIMLTCLAAGLLSAFFIAAAYGVKPLMIRELLLINAGYILMFMFIYSAALGAVMLTGSMMTFFMAFFWICIFSYVLGLIISALGSIYFRTGELEGEFINKIYQFSPVYWLAEFYDCLSRLFYRDILAPKSPAAATEIFARLNTALTVSTVTVILVSALAFLMFEKRQSEAAGKALAFRFTKTPVRIVLTVTVSLGFCIFGSYIGNEMNSDDIFWTAFFLVTGAAISHAVIEIIYNSDIRALVKDKAELLLCIVLACFVVSVFKYDLVGFDRYVPGLDALESIELSSTDFLPDKQQVRRAEYYAKGFTDYDYDDENIVIRDREDMANIISLIEGSNELNGIAESEDYYSRYTSGPESFYDYDHRIYLQINYKDGRESRRHYTCSPEAIEELLAPALEKKECREQLFPIIKLGDEDMGIMGLHIRDVSDFDPAFELYTYGNSEMIENINESRGRDDAIKVFDALKKDLREADFKDIISFDYMDESDEAARIVYVPEATVKNIELAMKNTGSSLKEVGGYDVTEDYPVPESFENTLSALRELGYI